MRSSLWKLLRAPGAALVWILVALIRFYQRIVSPGLKCRCRFEPSCSEYAAQSLQKDGLCKGSAKSIYRLVRCHPLGKPGYDPP